MVVVNLHGVDSLGFTYDISQDEFHLVYKGVPVISYMPTFETPPPGKLVQRAIEQVDVVPVCTKCMTKNPRLLVTCSMRVVTQQAHKLITEIVRTVLPYGPGRLDAYVEVHRPEEGFMYVKNGIATHIIPDFMNKDCDTRGHCGKNGYKRRYYFKKACEHGV